MNIRWFLALTLGCIVCLEWTLCEAARKEGRSSSGLAEHPGKPRGRKSVGRGRKLKLHLKDEEELHGKRHYRQTSCSGRSKNQSARRKKCACPPCEKCPVCPVCKEIQTTDSLPNVAITLEKTTQPTTTSTTPSTTTTPTTTPEPTTTPTTTTTTTRTTARTTTRRATTKSPLGLLLQTFGSFGNGFGSSLMNQDNPSGGGLLGGISFPNPFRNVIRMFSRIDDIRRKMQKGISNPFGLNASRTTTKPKPKCSKKSSNGNSKSDAIVVAINEAVSAPKSESKQVACSKVIELKHPGKIYICME